MELIGFLFFSLSFLLLCYYIVIKVIYDAGFKVWPSMRSETGRIHLELRGETRGSISEGCFASTFSGCSLTPAVSYSPQDSWYPWWCGLEGGRRCEFRTGAFLPLGDPGLKPQEHELAHKALAVVKKNRSRHLFLEIFLGLLKSNLWMSS